MSNELQHDMVHHPPHYTAHSSTVECIDIVEHLPFNLGNALKYLWRKDHKAQRSQDLGKALWYLERELTRRNGPGWSPEPTERVLAAEPEGVLRDVLSLLDSGRTIDLVNAIERVKQEIKQ